MSLPISAYLAVTSDGPILIDTGLASRNLRDEALRHRYFGDSDFPPPVVLSQHELLKQLDDIGLAPQDISQVVISHLHADHAGNLRHFGHARISVQRQEYEAALASLRRLKREAEGGKLVIGHDPKMIQQLRLAPDHYG